MASTTPKTILLTTNGAERPIHEAVADAALTPGEFLVWSADDQLGPHATAGGNSQRMVCVESPFDDDNTVAAIDSDYAAGDMARFVFAQPGDRVYAWLEAAANVAKGAALESDGAGGLQAHTAQAVDEGGTVTYTVYANAIAAWADEDKDNSAGTARVRIKVRVN